MEKILVLATLAGLAITTIVVAWVVYSERRKRLLAELALMRAADAQADREAELAAIAERAADAEGKRHADECLDDHDLAGHLRRLGRGG